MENRIEARLIGETSAGGLGLEIYEDGKLVYSHDYLKMGTTDAEYKAMLIQAIDDMLDIRNWSNWDGCERDEEGEVVILDRTLTTLTTLSFDGITWSFGGNDTISDDVIKANAHRLPVDIVNRVD